MPPTAQDLHGPIKNEKIELVDHQVAASLLASSSCIKSVKIMQT